MHTPGQREHIKYTQLLRLFSHMSSMPRDVRRYPQNDLEPMLSALLDGGLIFGEPRLGESCPLRVEAPLTINSHVVNLILVPISP